jgi:hypothetical protein
MPADQRELLMRRHFGDETLKQLAASLGIARSTLQIRVAAAEASFAKWYKKLQNGEDEPGPRKSALGLLLLAVPVPELPPATEALSQAQVEGWERLSRLLDLDPPREDTRKHQRRPFVNTVCSFFRSPRADWIITAVGILLTILGMLATPLREDVLGAHVKPVAVPVQTTLPSPLFVVPYAPNANGVPDGDAWDQVEDVPGGPDGPEMPPLQLGKATTEAEIQLLNKARRASTAGDLPKVISLLEEHKRDYPNSPNKRVLDSLRERAEARLAAKQAKEAAAAKAKP